MEPTKCPQCEIAFKPRQSSQQFCSKTCYWGSLRKQRNKDVSHRMRSAHGHPIAPPSGIVAIARLNLYETIGAGPHPCHWCGELVTWRPGNRTAIDALFADHLDWDTTNDDPANLVAACNPCNAHRRKTRHSKRIVEDDLTVMWGGVSTRAVRRTCETCGEGFLIPPAATKQGKGRFCSRSCARRAPRRPKA